MLEYLVHTYIHTWYIYTDNISSFRGLSVFVRVARAEPTNPPDIYTSSIYYSIFTKLFCVVRYSKWEFRVLSGMDGRAYPSPSHPCQSAQGGVVSLMWPVMR